MKPICTFLFLLLANSSLYSQSIPSKQDLVNHYGFVQHELLTDQERIVYYTHQKGSAEKSKLVVYLQGSDPSPLFSYSLDQGEIKRFCFLPADFQRVGEEYLFVAIEKIGFEEVIDENNIPKPPIYQTQNSLHNRVFRANEVINHLNSTHSFSHIIVYGHSEGAPVAAKLATTNPHITHLGFWAGNALPDFFDFVLETRKEYYKGNIDMQTAQDQIDETIQEFVEEVAKDTANVSTGGYTHLRWWSYAEPPIHHLLTLDIPIYVQVATEDESAPIESTYLIPLEFARLQKSNLTYKVCVGCNHSFRIPGQQGNAGNKWPEIFTNFIQWTEMTPR